MRKRADCIDKLYQVAEEFGSEIIFEAATMFDEYYSSVDLENSNPQDLCLTAFVALALVMRRKQ